jgi:hypothetical protein
VNVEVPFIIRLTGDEDFYYSFVDDIVSGDASGNGRYVELNNILPEDI